MLLKHNIQPNKRLGQNFLIDKKVLDKIIETADLSKNDVVLEIGPGLGTLTEELAKKAKKVIAVEKDKSLIPILNQKLKKHKNIEIIQGDVLKITDYGLRVTDYKVVANIPYYLTSRLIRIFLESKNPPKEMILMIQKEVAQRILAKAPKTNLLAVSVQFYGKPQIAFYVSKNSFLPKPKVDSAVIKITDIKKPENVDVKAFFKVVKAGFSAPRKQLANNLSKKLGFNKKNIQKKLVELGLPATARAENLSVREWINLLRNSVSKLT